MVDDVASRFYEKKHMDRLKIKIKLLGINYDVYFLLGLKIIFSFLILLFFLVFLKAGYIIAPMAALLFYFGSEYFFIDLQIKKRKYKLEDEALQFFPIFLNALNGGKNVKKALIISTEIIDNELSNLFVTALHEVEIGKSLEEALTDLSKCIPSSTINNIILNIISSLKYGNSVSESVNRQLDLIGTKKKNYLIKKAKKQPVLLTFLCIFFFLIMLLVINIFV